MTLYAVDYSGLQAGNTALISGAGTIGALTVLSLNAARASQIFVAKPNPAINQLMQERARVVEEVSRLKREVPSRDQQVVAKAQELARGGPLPSESVGSPHLSKAASGNA